MPALSGSTTHNYSDPVLRGSLFDTFRNSIDKSEKLYKKCGFKEVPSDKAFEEITEFAGLGIAQRREQLQQGITDVVKEGYTTRIEQYAYSMNNPVSYEALKFKKYRDAIMGMESVAESMATTIEILHADVFANAFSSTLGLLPDGQPICSASHKLPRGGTFSTTLGAVALSETGFETALIAADKIPAGNGIPMGKKAKGLVGPPEYKFEAKRILKSQLQNNTANNAINALADEGLNYVSNRHFASSSNWFMNLETKYGLMTIWTEKPNVVEVGQDLNRATIYSGNMMLGIACVDPRCLLGSSV